MSGRRLLVLAVIVAALGIAAVAYVRLASGPPPGPLQPTDLVESFGTYAEDGSSVSLVVELRGEVPVTATLEAVALADPDPGLSLIGTGILTAPFEGYVVKGFPPGPLAPLAGTEFIARPGDPTGDVFIALGIKADLAQGRQSVRGVWLDYAVEGRRYRALLPWLLTICAEPGTEPCPNQPPGSFEMPSPGG